MSRKIFINLAVADLQRSIDFFTGLGFTFNPQFSDASGTCMVISPEIHAMLLTHDKFKSFLPPGRTMVDSSKSHEMFLALNYDSRAEVDALVDKALATGGTKAQSEPADHGFMYGRSFHDPDGHAWEIFWFDPAALK
ncbi:MAG: VOC family protein [Pirellulales bacterium]